MSSGGGQGTTFLPNNGRVLQSGATRILCVADVRGMLEALQDVVQILTLARTRQSKIAERSRTTSKGELHNSYRRFWFLRRRVIEAYCR